MPIERGDLFFFCAKVSARKAGLELGDAYLGGCIYASYEAFYEEKSGYFADLVTEAVANAKEQIEALCGERESNGLVDQLIYNEITDILEKEDGRDAVVAAIEIEQYKAAYPKIYAEVQETLYCSAHDI